MQHILLKVKSPEGKKPSLKNQKRWQKGSLIFIYTTIDPRQNTGVNDKVIDGFKTESSQKFHWRIADAI